MNENKINETLSGITDKEELAEKKALLEVLSQLGHGSNQAHQLEKKIKSAKEALLGRFSQVGDKIKPVEDKK